ncbi:MAG TPA: DUF4150 domain-containing protein [Minicystis sp.]|nr:DUF4150 domain-containing protein [Minicystis sp.]
MAATVNVNLRTVVHARSDGVSMAFPDVCKTPTPAGPIPIPYPNVAMSSDASQGSTDTTCDGQSIMVKGAAFSKSTGDEAGSAGGVVSNTIQGKAEFILYSFDVKVEGKNVCRLGDLMLHNELGSTPNTPPFPEIQPPSISISLPDAEEPEQAEKQRRTRLVRVKEA